MNTVTAKAPARAENFYFRMALCFVAVAFLGFTPTYFLPLARGTLHSAPVVHIHALVFFLWPLLYAYQTWLVASGRTLRHRDLGLLGISIATAMVFLGLLVGVASVWRATALGFADQAREFLLVPVSGILLFASLFAMAIYFVKNKDIHKRLMLMASASMLDAPVARLFMTLLAPPLESGASPVPPVMAVLPPALLIDGFIIAGIVYDWRTRGRPHPVYLLGGALVLLVQLLRAPISTTIVWDRIAVWLVHFIG